MRALYLTSVTLHVLAAAFWLGSSLFLAAVLVPAIRDRAPAERAALFAETGRRLRALVWPAFALLVVTGAIQLAYRGYRFRDLSGAVWAGPGGSVLAWKMALFALTLGISGLHDFVLGPRAVAAVDSATRERRRRLASWLGRVTLLLAIAIVAAAVAFVRGGF
jgi:uncharacterized membrane protein